MRLGVAAGVVIFLIILGCPVKAMQAALGLPPQHTSTFAAARQATWGVALLRFSADGELQDVALSGSGFFVSPRHFITAAHVIDTRKLLSRARGPRDEIRVFRTDPFENGFHGPLRIVFESAAMDAAVLESTAVAPHWLRVSMTEPKEGEEVGLYGYPLAAWNSKLAPVAYALGRIGIVAGFTRPEPWRLRRPSECNTVDRRRLQAGVSLHGHCVTHCLERAAAPRNHGRRAQTP